MPVFLVAEEPGHQRDPRLFGHVLERAWKPELGAEATITAEGQVRDEVTELMAGLEIPMIRSPGGGVVVDAMRAVDPEIEIIADTAEKLPVVEQPVKISSIPTADRLSLVDAVATCSEDRLFVHFFSRELHAPQEVQVRLQGKWRQLSGGRVHTLQGPLSNTRPAEKALRISTEKTQALGLNGTYEFVQVQVPARSVVTLELQVAESKMSKTPEEMKDEPE